MIVLTRTVSRPLLLPAVFGVLLAGCAGSSSHRQAQSEYCLKAGKNQAYDCQATETSVTGETLRIRPLPIDDETLFARVEAIKHWLAEEKQRLSENSNTHSNPPPSLVSPAPEANAPPSVEQETLAAAITLFQRGNQADALSLVQNYRQLNPESLDGILVHSRLLIGMDKSSEAEALLTDTLKDHPDQAAVYNNLAAAQAAQGNLGGAVETLQKAFATDTTFARIQENLKQLYRTTAQRALATDIEVPTPTLELIDTPRHGSLPGN
ncbi:MAG: hypothetical protein CMI01_07005 [Oceanospirillaceae bacterium]|nr:hypothetical protein [Oceanospirillaceae bacterium]